MKKGSAYNPAEVAEVAGVTRRTVYSWITTGELPAHKAGPKLWRVYPDVLAAFLAGGSVEAKRVDDKIQGRALSAVGGSVSTPKPAPIVKASFIKSATKPLDGSTVRPVQSLQQTRESPGAVSTPTTKPTKTKPKQAGRRR